LEKENNIEEGKKENVRNMFNNIAGKYDFLNHFLSMNIDHLWRRKVVKILSKHKHDSILDVATGTADLAIAAIKLHPTSITGIDISDEMLKIGREKLINKKMDAIIKLQTADSENLPFDNDSFDACMVAFGVRNFEDLNKGLSEMYRVIKPNGVVVILEFSKPKSFPVKQIYGFYFKNILPILGKMISKDNFAYTYLPDSVSKFPEGNDFVSTLKTIGFKELKRVPLTFGIATIYHGIK